MSHSVSISGWSCVGGDSPHQDDTLKRKYIFKLTSCKLLILEAAFLLNTLYDTKCSFCIGWVGVRACARVRVCVEISEEKHLKLSRLIAWYVCHSLLLIF